MAEENKYRNNHPSIPDEVHPFNVESSKDTLRIRAFQPQNMNLDHLGDMFEEVTALGNGQDIERARTSGSADMSTQLQT